MYKLNLQYWNKEKLASIVFVIVGLLMGRVVLFGGINGCAIGYLTCFLFNKNIFYAVAVTIFTGLMTVRKTMDIGEYVIAIVLMCLFNFLGNGRQHFPKPSPCQGQYDIFLLSVSLNIQTP